MPRIAVIAARADALCARLNDGLAAVAIVLAILTVALGTVRTPVGLGTLDAEWPIIEVPDEMRDAGLSSASR
jgi:hypothetical protein